MSLTNTVPPVPGAPVAQGTEFRVDAFQASFQTVPAAAVLEDGSIVIVWEAHGPDGDASGIYGRRYDAGGAPLGNEFLVNAFTSGWQNSPSIAALHGGGFVVTWASYNQDGSGFGIFLAAIFPNCYESRARRSSKYLDNFLSNRPDRLHTV